MVMLVCIIICGINSFADTDLFLNPLRLAERLGFSHVSVGIEIDQRFKMG